MIALPGIRLKQWHVASPWGGHVHPTFATGIVPEIIGSRSALNMYVHPTFFDLVTPLG